MSNTQQSWMCNSRTGQWRNPEGELLPERGYSGTPGFINNPATEQIPFMGPIPTGEWQIGAMTNRPTRTGPDSIQLSPVGHDAYGRDRFFIHGESRERPGAASAGCPILTRTRRQQIGNSRVRRLIVMDEPEWE